jgi:H+/Cl- antiporter ClcA
MKTNVSVQSFIAGIALFILGVRIVYNPHIYNYVYRYEFDFTDFNIPLGLTVAMCGIVLVWSACSRKSKRDK